MKTENITERKLDERESSILNTIVYEYIVSGKPVGSRSFVQKYSLAVSPATMRNIMFDLEGIGYLKQPHTSAGRIPTDRGYRFYVNSLLDSYHFNMSEEFDIKVDAIRRELQLDRIFQSVTRMLSMVSKYSGVILTPRSDFAVIKRIELIPIDNSEVICVIITRTGKIINRKVVVSANPSAESLYEFSKYLTGELGGYTMHEIKETIFDRLRSYRGQMDLAIDIAQLAMGDTEEPEMHVEGIENLLKIPEMVEEARLNSLLNIIEEKNILRMILAKTMESDGVRTLIGEEIDEPRVSGCSMVSAPYRIGDKNVGVLGVLGPTRMDYKRVVPLVDYTGKLMSDFLTQMSR
jgi:heat-inducible transcriptional repressor